MMNRGTLNFVISAISSLPAHVDEDQYLGQIIDIICDNFGFHYVGLFLIDSNRQEAVFRAGTGEPGRQLLVHRHRFRLNRNSSLVAQVINLGEINVYEPVYPASYYWGHRFYKCSLPPVVQLDSPLEFHLADEAELTNWRLQSALPPPIGWEMCFPVRIGGCVFGALDIQIQLPLGPEERQTWAGQLLAEPDQYIDFELEECTKLQWLIDQVAVFLESRGFINQ